MSFLIERDKKTVSLSDCSDPSNKIEIDISAWDQVKNYVFDNFDKRLAEVNQHINWRRLSTQIDRYLGKELFVLFCVINQSQPEQYQFAAKNWSKLSPEDRWYFYFKIKAHGRQWAKGAYFALAEY